MGFVYAVINVLLPVSLLVYQSLAKFRASEEIPFGKWAVMIVLVYIFNWVSWLFDESYLVFFLDLLLKVCVSFLPDSYNSKIQNLISNLHLEVWLDQFRCWVIAGFHTYYWKVTDYVLSKMENGESNQFRQALLMNLKGQKTQHHDTFAFKPVKHFVNIGVNCDKVSEEMAQNISSTAKILEAYSRKIVQDKNLHNQTFGQIKPTREVPEKLSSHLQPAKFTQPKKQELPMFTYKKKQPQRIVKQLPDININLRASNQQLDLSDNDQPPVRPQLISPISKKAENHVMFKAVSKKPHDTGIKNQSKLIGHQAQEQSEFKRAYTFTEQTNSQISSRAQNFKKAYREDGQAFREEDLIDKLELSSSEYSGMFDEEDDEDLKTLECKVEAILEIGSGASSRLEIYNLELYSNRELKIVSLYGREFESHRLKAMKALPSSYYELLFEEGKIGSRKCKFRGAHSPFMKFLAEN